MRGRQQADFQSIIQKRYANFDRPNSFKYLLIKRLAPTGTAKQAAKFGDVATDEVGL